MTATAPCCAVAWLGFGPDHPALDGHFPGRPIVPGVVLLDHARDLLRVRSGDVDIAGMPVVKFLEPVLPGQTLLMGVEVVDDATARFICRRGSATVAHGTFTLGRRIPS